MGKFVLHEKGKTAAVVLERDAVYGMEDMAHIFCEDIKRVTGTDPNFERDMPDGTAPVILVATCGHSKMLEELEQSGAVDFRAIKGKREVYGIFLLDGETGISGRDILLIAGSDKRGTIYGMFYISQKIGVSPWVFWADAVPKQRDEVVFGDDIATVSHEPSVRYRGFFINDEQPCFGNWAKEKYGSAKPGPQLYRHIFELLLRLKGNYIWPAMWRSDFTMDHIENAELANRMGVIVGASHHEPCCRSGGEFQKLRHENPEYGTEWSFLSNEEGISKFWKDGLIRNQDFESLITIGMRGEADSYLMPEDATLEDNINVLKKAITAQKRLIQQYGNKQHPQLLAIYKEVEDYYQGDENTEGLKDWDVLRDDIMMLCDDNFGNLRTLPGEEERKHPGGYGMYYHFDYYGAPVSYLWINSTPLTKIWEQMTMAYDFGVREAWIVNVGDIKNQELPLSYFLDLAYDFEKWGTGAINQTERYTGEWLESLGFTEPEFAGLPELVQEYTKWNGTCRPEVLKSSTYHPAHGGEAIRMLERVREASQKAELLWKKIENESPLAECFYQIVYYPVMASANIIEMQICSGLNQFYVRQRKKKGNGYSSIVERCIRKDRDLVEEYQTRNGGKWSHMQSVYHIGYIGWNDEEWRYPDCHTLYPVCAPRLLVSIAGEVDCTGGNPWRRRTQYIRFTNPGTDESGFEVANGGAGKLEYRIEWEADWLEIVPAGSAGEADDKADVESADGKKVIRAEADDCREYLVRVKPEAYAAGDSIKTASIHIYGENCEETAERSENEYSDTRVDIEVQAEALPVVPGDETTFVEHNGILSIEAPHFCQSVSEDGAVWKVIENYGKTVGGVKVFPVTKQFAADEAAPAIGYRVFVKEAGEYSLELYTAPSNPVVYEGKMCVSVMVNDGDAQVVNTIPDNGYVPWLSDKWACGVLEQIHKSSCGISLRQGVNVITIKAMDPAVVLEKMVITKKGTDCPESYLGPVESIRI